jgi:hypothetical protein
VRTHPCPGTCATAPSSLAIGVNYYITYLFSFITNYWALRRFGTIISVINSMPLTEGNFKRLLVTLVKAGVQNVLEILVYDILRNDDNRLLKRALSYELVPYRFISVEKNKNGLRAQPALASSSIFNCFPFHKRG